MKEIWTAVVEVLTPPSEAGDTRAFTNVVALAEDADNYRESITRLFEKSSCLVLGIEDCVRVEDCTSLPDELHAQIKRLKAHPEDCIFGTLHYYPSNSS